MNKETTGATAFADDPPLVGERSMMTIGDLELECGVRLTGTTLSYGTWGTLSPTGDNAILVHHGLISGCAAGPLPGESGWFSDQIGPGRALDTERDFIVCPNVLGGCDGSTGPASPAPWGHPYGSAFPTITVRDQVNAEMRLANALGIQRWRAIVGVSMGGMRTLEWAVSTDRVDRIIAMATSAAASADHIAIRRSQRLAITEDADFNNGDYYPELGPVAGFKLARMAAEVWYRSPAGLERRFGNDPQDDERVSTGGRFAVEGYLDHLADKVANSFDANSYLVLGRAMDRHDVGRNRDGVRHALATITAPTHVVAVTSDRLYPITQQQHLVEMLPSCDELTVIESDAGHDAVVVESTAVDAILRGALGREHVVDPVSRSTR